MSENSVPMAGSPPTNVGGQALAFLLFLMLCFGTAAIGTVWTNASLADWYEQIAKPSWNPPNWVFGPVWSVLYFMIATAGWLVWRTGKGDTTTWCL